MIPCGRRACDEAFRSEVVIVHGEEKGSQRCLDLRYSYDLLRLIDSISSVANRKYRPYTHRITNSRACSVRRANHDHMPADESKDREDSRPNVTLWPSHDLKCPSDRFRADEIGAPAPNRDASDAVACIFDTIACTRIGLSPAPAQDAFPSLTIVSSISS